MNRFKACLGLMLAGAVRFAGAQEPLLALYNPRPPYLVPDANGRVSGLTASVAAAAFEEAGIAFKWVEYPSERQMLMLRKNTQRVACVGWFRTPEREAYAKFSVPLYQDRRTAVLARRDNARVAAARSVDDLLRDPALLLLVKTGYSYGPFLNDRILEDRPRTDSVVAENVNMIQMIGLRHGDYMFIAPEEAEAVIRATGLDEAVFRLSVPLDMPPGEKRYILYSKRIDDATIERVDRGIKAYQARHR